MLFFSPSSDVCLSQLVERENYSITNQKSVSAPAGGDTKRERDAINNSEDEIIFHFSRVSYWLIHHIIYLLRPSICLLCIDNVFLKDFFLDKVNNLHVYVWIYMSIDWVVDLFADDDDDDVN